MALTPEGTPYVEASDLVAAYPAASLSLANRVDLVGVLPFADSAARTTALPSPSDGQYSYLQDTNSTEFWNGASWQAIGSGKILQIVNATKLDTFTTTSTTLVDVTGLSVTITPASASNTIMVFCSLALQSTAGDGQQSWGRILRASTSLGGTAASNRPSGNFAVNQAASAYGHSPLAFQTVDSPATTSATIYKVQIAARSATTAGVNIASNDNDQTYVPRMASSITVMEISA
jgi:hypothetical protein